MGANIGAFSIACSNYNVKKIYAFEPINSPTVWGELLNIQNDKIVCINVALSDKDEDDVLIYPASNNFESSSLFKPNTHLSEFSWVEFGEPIKVNAKRLDSFPFHKNFDVMIMDVQGAEYKVLNGISNFENIKLIILEYGIPDSYFGACSFQEINDLLSKAGFVYQESFSTYYNETTKAYFANAVFLKIDGVQHMLDQTNPWNKTENFEGEVKVYYDNLLKHLTRFKNKTFVETGTYIGNGLNCAIKAGFDKCQQRICAKNKN
jgi:FkbM family methyltransferase